MSESKEKRTESEKKEKRFLARIGGVFTDRIVGEIAKVIFAIVISGGVFYFLPKNIDENNKTSVDSDKQVLEKLRDIERNLAIMDARLDGVGPTLEAQLADLEDGTQELSRQLISLQSTLAEVPDFRNTVHQLLTLQSGELRAILNHHRAAMEQDLNEQSAVLAGLQSEMTAQHGNLEAVASSYLVTEAGLKRERRLQLETAIASLDTRVGNLQTTAAEVRALAVEAQLLASEFPLSNSRSFFGNSKGSTLEQELERIVEQSRKSNPKVQELRDDLKRTTGTLLILARSGVLTGEERWN